MDIKESIESVRRQFRSDSDPFPSDKDSLENLKNLDYKFFLFVHALDFVDLAD